MIAHVDADSFFASVLVRSNPGLQGKPLLAIGMGGGCVIAATYEAKAKGVKTGMPLFEARKLVPGAIEMAADFRETGLASEQIESILRSVCPIVQQYSIDEWFMDLGSIVGGAPKDPEAWGRDIQTQVRLETALSVSVGIAGSKLLSKMASEERKPAGVTYVSKDSAEAFLRKRPAAAIPGIGRQRTAKTDAIGLLTAWDIAVANPSQIVPICGRPGLEMQRELLGERVEGFVTEAVPPKSISRCRTFKATDDRMTAKAYLLKHLEYCVMKMRRWNLGAAEVSVWLRAPDFAYRGAHRKLGKLAITADDIAGPALSALGSLTWHGQRFNQIGLALTNLQNADIRQQSLFDDPNVVMGKEKLQEAMDALHTRYGRDSVTRASALSVSTGTTKGLEFSMVE